jgi:hypothetical protein
MSQPLALDTPPEAEARQIALFRQRTPEERLEHAFDLSSFALTASRAAIRRSQPHLSPTEQARLLVALMFGADHAAHVLDAPTVEGPLTIPSAILPVVQIFTQLRVPYFIGGSIASSAYSIPRTTYDVDIIADLPAQHVAAFIRALEQEYYIDQSAILDALARRASFNMLHHATGINIDIFVPAARAYDREQFARVQTLVLPGTTQAVNVASPEDVLLNKLAWFERGNRVSDQQWRNVQSILRVQGDALDTAYMRRCATSLNLGKLLAGASTSAS